MPISRIGTDGIDQTSSQQIGGISVGRGGGAVSTNTAVGASALAANTTAADNTAIGYQAAYNTTTDGENTAIGHTAFYSNTTGNRNVAVGKKALYSNTGADGNTAVGYEAALNTTTSELNAAFGFNALRTNSTGGNNTALGSLSLYSNTTASNNTAVGYQAGYSNTTGANLVALGYQAGYSSNANNNTFIGYYAGQGTTGTLNTFVGVNGVGYLVSSGTKNTIIGGYSGNQGLDIRTASNYVVLSDGDGNTQAWVQGTVYSNSWYQRSNSSSWATTSDQRIKKNIENVKDGLQTILALRPVEFDYIITGAHDTGFIAQEYEQVLPHQITHEENASQEVKELTNGEPVKGIQQNLVPYLVAAIKELKAEFDAYKEAHP